MDTRALARRSIEIIRAGQAPSGGYVASPSFAPYGFSWMRDGSFIADAMSRVREVESAVAFFDWASRVILARRGREHLAARYTLDGEDDAGGDWPLLQHDGYGLWLWALRGHAERHGRDLDRWGEAGDVTADYLERVCREPCTDWWEERVGLHAATLASIAAGLRAWGREGVDVSIAEDRTDASLLALVPLGLGGADVIERVERELVSPGGGVHRHREDVYYGGGEWLLLTAMLGWAYALTGSSARASEKLDWVASHATAEGEMPEQSQDHLLHPQEWRRWFDKWGPPANPLLWSHAMFLTLAHELGEV